METEKSNLFDGFDFTDEKLDDIFSCLNISIKHSL